MAYHTEMLFTSKSCVCYDSGIIDRVGYYITRNFLNLYKRACIVNILTSRGDYGGLGMWHECGTQKIHAKYLLENMLESDILKMEKEVGV
jgi:hypothetical protein